MDPLSGGIIGSLLGGIFRLVPEALKWLDRKSEREHELNMFKETCALEQLRGSIRMQEVGAIQDAITDIKVLDTFKASIESQTDMVKAAGKGWIASISASVRPVVTYFILGMWALFHLYIVATSKLPSEQVFSMMMSVDFVALVSGIINYWFLDRTLAKRGL
jgi:hypothetical protein